MNKKFILYKITYLFRKVFQICIYVHKYFFILVILTKLNQFYLGLGLSCLKPQKKDAPAFSRLHDNSFLPSLYCSLCPFGTSRLYLAGKTESASWKTLLSAARFMFQFCISFFFFFACPVRLAFPFPFHPEKPDTEWVKGVVFRRHWWRAGVKGGGSCGHKTSLALALPERERSFGLRSFGPLVLGRTERDGTSGRTGRGLNHIFHPLFWFFLWSTVLARQGLQIKTRFAGLYFWPKSS